MKHDFFTIKGSLDTIAATLVDGTGIGYTGGNPIPVVITSGASATSAVNVVDSGGVAYTTSNPLPVTGDIGTVTTVTGITNTLAANIVDSTGEAYTTSNPVPVTGTVVVSSVTATTAANVVDSTGVAYSGANRLPTLNRPINIRGSLATAYATSTTGEETTLLAGVASTYHDLIYVMGANSSDAAINLGLRCTVGGNVQMSLEVPANGTAGVSLPVPMPQSDVDATWTVQNVGTDVSTTTYKMSALFSKES